MARIRWLGTGALANLIANFWHNCICTVSGSVQRCIYLHIYKRAILPSDGTFCFGGVLCAKNDQMKAGLGVVGSCQ